MNDNIDIFAYEVLRAFALTHNYNEWIYKIFQPYLGSCVLEVGSGIGNLTKYFFKSCKKLIGIDISGSFLSHLKIDYPELELYNYDISKNDVLSLSNRKIDTIVCVNVLEHIADEKKALQNMYNLLQTNGHLLLFVPALNWLFGSLDKNANHCRRYDKKLLKNLLEQNGFKLEKMFYSNFIGIFGWFVNGKILKRKSFPIVQPILFDKMVPFLTKIEEYIRPPIGMSLIVIVKK
ncbi:MAG: class I SAM-dependent methyltransferase [Elusimicrobia bacterium]|nr:class I SAM-dependent methyltransferase [Elusimicrobiota bacterium]